MKSFDKKKHDARRIPKIKDVMFLECAERHVFRLSKITNFEGVFGFCNEGTPYFDCVKADDFR